MQFPTVSSSWSAFSPNHLVGVSGCGIVSPFVVVMSAPFLLFVVFPLLCRFPPRCFTFSVWSPPLSSSSRPTASSSFPAPPPRCHPCSSSSSSGPYSSLSRPRSFLSPHLSSSSSSPSSSSGPSSVSPSSSPSFPLSAPRCSPLSLHHFPYLLVVVVSSPHCRRVAPHIHRVGVLFRPGGEDKPPTSLWKGEGRRRLHPRF